MITDAPRSHAEQLRSRQVRYLVMMSIRAVCLIVAAVLVGARVPLLALWLTLCVLAMVLLPWFAVLIANDRPVKDAHRLRQQRASDEAPPNALTPRGEPTVIDPHTVIDAER